MGKRKKKTIPFHVTKETINMFHDNKELMVEEFWKEQPFFYDEVQIFWIWDYQQKMWKMVDEVNLLNSLKKIAQSQANSLTNKFWNETMRAFKLVGRRHEPKPFDKNWIQFKNKIVDLKTGKEFKASSEYFNCNPIPHDLSESTETPIIDEIFTSWVGEPYLITLKEIVAYTMLQDYPLHRIICFTGAGMNGKGVFLRFIRKFIGEHNVCASELENLIDGRFGTSNLYRKLCCQMGETNFEGIKRTSMLKSLSGQDKVKIEFKYKKGFEAVNYAKILISTNSLPPTTDRTIGFYRRWMIIDFPNTFEEGKDPLSKIPREEYERFARQSLSILKNLLKRGTFHKDGDINERMRRYEEKSNPLISFLEENYEKDEKGEVVYYRMYEAFNDYVGSKGLRRLTKVIFAKKIKEEGYEIERHYVDIDGVNKQVSCVMGLKEKKVSQEKETMKEKKPLTIILEEIKKQPIMEETLLIIGEDLGHSREETKKFIEKKIVEGILYKHLGEVSTAIRITEEQKK